MTRAAFVRIRRLAVAVRGRSLSNWRRARRSGWPAARFGAPMTNCAYAASAYVLRERTPRRRKKLSAHETKR
eukprot:31454-Pelagococcus_subviridis.AAC.12